LEDNITTGVVAKCAFFLDQRAGLIAVQARHHDVHEDDVRLMVGDLGESIETVFGEDDLATGLHQEISALRRMVFESSITITLTPARFAVSLTLFTPATSSVSYSDSFVGFSLAVA